MPFTPSQQEAISARSRELLVSAAAGSGKTAVLVERILRMIARDGLDIGRMLIVTFTRAAAGEMRERLETRLLAAAGENARLQKQADQVASAQISTIHAFCQQVVRQNFQHCQIDPQFGLCDERTRQAFYDESMEETLDWLYDAAGENPELAALCRKFPERDIAGMLDALYRFLISRPDPLEWLDFHAQKEWSESTIDREPMSAAFCREAALIVEGMLSLWQGQQEAANRPSFPVKYLSTLRLDGIELRTLADACARGLTALLGALRALTFSRLPVVKPETSDEAALAEGFKTARQRYKDMVDSLRELLPQSMSEAIEDMRAMRPATRGLAQAALHFHETFSAKKRDQAVIDFNDLEHMTLSILREPSLRAQLQNRFDAIFVDEYQDVSELQEAILNGLKRETAQYAFYVGDVKQSIYRFRLAEPGLFLGKLAAFSAEPGAERRKIVLNRNFRSRTAVLDAVNRVFGHVMDSRVTEIDYDADARLYPGIPSRDDPPVELHILDDAALPAKEAVLAEAEWIARDIQRRVGENFHYRDIAVLLPVGKNVADQVELTLSRHGIPVYAEGTRDPAAADEVIQLTQYLTVLDNLQNDLALLSVLRSPLFDMTESELSAVRLKKPEREASFLMALKAAAEEEGPLAARCQTVLDTLQNERFYLSSMPLGDYLWDFLGRSGLYAHYGAQPGGRLRQANLRMLCTRAGDYEQTHIDGLRGFLEALSVEGSGAEQGPAVVNPWEDVVRVMTIHKSKGLEFPTVYVMNLGRPLFGRPSTRSLSVHGEMGFGLSYVNEEARTRRSTLLQGAIALRERNAARAERARLLYVALTRPRDRLVMVGTGDYGEALSHPSPSDRHAVRAAGSMLDWLVQCVAPTDTIRTVEGFSTYTIRKTESHSEFPTQSTSFPQQTGVWEVVFHMGLSADALKAPAAEEKPIEALPAADAPSERLSMPFARREGEDPIAPRLRFTHAPLKVGVTALCRALDGDLLVEEEETADAKRLPLMVSRPRLLSSLPETPAFLSEPRDETALQIGVETHRVLGLLDLDRAREGQSGFAASEVKRLQSEGVITEAQAAHVDLGMIDRFLQSDLGKRMLASPRVMREWAFNLRVTEPFDTIVQGVIDLCFLEDGAWVLVDFKTDRVRDASALWPRYRRQLAYYREALRLGTPYPVAHTLLYALRLGQASEEEIKL